MINWIYHFRVREDLRITASEISHIDKGPDIFDIWFDSGVSWAFALPDGERADVVLEGIDQFRGWFQSLLLTSVASDRGTSPFKTILAHSFVTDDDGNKMSKSLGNVIDPYDITDGTGQSKIGPKQTKTGLGVDGLRFWAASCGLVHGKTRISSEFLGAIGEKLKQIRTVLRFILGATRDLGDANVSIDNLPLIDRYMLHRCNKYQKEVEMAYEEYEYNRVLNVAENFLNGDVSNFYCSMIKDRLYCDSQSSQRRRAVQVVLKSCGSIFVSTLAPIVPHMAEEFDSHSTQNQIGVFKMGWQSHPEWQSVGMEKLFETRLLPLREAFLYEHGMKRTDQLHLLISTGDQKLAADLAQLQPDQTSYNSGLTELFKVSQVSMTVKESGETKLSLLQTGMFHCERCRRFCKETEEQYLCNRCIAVLS